MDKILNTDQPDRPDELIDLVKSVIVFVSQLTSLKWLTLLLGSL